MVVTAGESFRVEFSLNATPDDDSFEAPDFGAFDVLAGPAISQGHSIQIINGAMTKNVNYTITYVLLAQDAGNITIGPASIKVDKKDTRPSLCRSRSPTNRRQAAPGLRREIQTLRMKVSRRKPRDRLPKTICCCASTYRNSRSSKANPCWRPSSSTAGWRSWATKTLNSSFNGFWTQDIDVSNAMWQRETLNGKVYESTVVKSVCSTRSRRVRS